MQATITLDAGHTAVLVLAYQNGVIGNYLQKQPDLIDRAAGLLRAARDAGVPVVYIVTSFREGYPEVSPRNRLFSRLRASGSLRDGGEGAAIHAGVAPRPGDVVVVKRRLGPFTGTDLDAILRGLETTTLVMFGAATNGVVYASLAAAADLDYQVVVVEDCCADRDDEVQRLLMQKVFPNQASVVQAAQVVQALQAMGSDQKGEGER